MYNFNPYQINNPIYPQMYQPQQINQPQFTVKQVTNIEEAKASIIDPISTNLFIDFNSGKIYMKRLNNNGLSDFYVFAVEHEQKKIDPMEIINQRLINIENKLGGISNDKSIPSNANNSESNGHDDSTNVSNNAKSESSIGTKSK